MQFEVFTLLPEVFPSYLDTSIIKRARERGLIHVRVHNIRDYTHDKHHMTDDTPYGGGGGMVMKPDPVFEAVETVIGLNTPFNDSLEEPSVSVRDEAIPTPPNPDSNIPIILLTPQGRVFNQTIAQELSAHPRIALICGRYEGVDQRFIDAEVQLQISLGDFVLSGGEIAALALLNALARLQPGVLGDEDSHQMDSFNPALDGLLDCPHYTRPEVWQGVPAPPVLMSGHHVQIERWRREQRLALTARQRPELLAAARQAGRLDKADEAFLTALGRPA